MKGETRMLRYLMMLGAAAIAAVLMVAPANAAAVADSVISTDIRNIAVPEPATMMLLGTGLLAAFRDRRQREA